MDNITCGLCDKKIGFGIIPTYDYKENKYFCSQTCISYYQYPTKEDYLKSLKEYA